MDLDDMIHLLCVIAVTYYLHERLPRVPLGHGFSLCHHLCPEAALVSHIIQRSGCYVTRTRHHHDHREHNRYRQCLGVTL